MAQELTTTVKKIMALLDSKKATDIKAINISKLSALADYFVIASASNSSLVQSLSDDVEEMMSKELGIEPRRIEGYQSASWILLDFGDIIVHIFYRDAREYYGLDKLWSDGETLDISDVLVP